MKTLRSMWLPLTILTILSTPSLVAQTTTLHLLEGDGVTDEFAFSVAGAGDVNADGVPDLIVGADRDDNGFTDSGRATVYSGADGSVLHVFDGAGTSAHFGTSVAAVGDVNADGCDDFMVGATYQPSPLAGYAVVYSGKDGAVLHTWSAGGADQFGKSVVGLGDVNADGRPDVAVGAWVESVTGIQNGGAYVYSGLDGSLLYSFHGELNNDFFGEDLAGGADVTGDGIGDLVVGARQASLSAGKAYVYSGADGSLVWTFTGSPFARLGQSLALLGDLNSDGRSEIAVGALDKVFVYSGIDAALLYTLNREFQGDQFGFAIAGPGDTDGDGIPDLVAGAYGDNDSGSAAGSVRVYSGADGSVLYQVNGRSSGALLGFAVAAAGDVDGDGLGDFIAGACPPYHSANQTGYARVFSGRCQGSFARYGNGTAGSGGFTPDLDACGCPAPSASFELNIAAVAGGSPGLILLSVAPASLPGLGGVILVAPPFLTTVGLFVQGAGAGNGAANLRAVIADSPLVVGATIYLQSLFLDSGAPQGISMTNGLSITLR